MGNILRGLSDEQKAALARLKFGDSRTWPDVPDQLERGRLSHEADVAVMTYASEMFSWYAGSLDADTCFCPERHGMYFGGLGLKTAPAMGRRNYSISTTLTGHRDGAAPLPARRGCRRGTGPRALAAVRRAGRRAVVLLCDGVRGSRPVADGGPEGESRRTASRRCAGLPGAVPLLFSDRDAAGSEHGLPVRGVPLTGAMRYGHAPGAAAISASRPRTWPAAASS
jgi:hypothetical protein